MASGSAGATDSAKQPVKAAKPKPPPKPSDADETEFEQMQVVGMAERGGFEPPVPLLGVHTISSRAPSTARSPLRFAMSTTYARHPVVQLPKCLQNVSTGLSADCPANLPELSLGGKDELQVG
jgi:hypothetical protein